MFTILEDAYAVLYSKGVYRQVKVYSRAGKVYAQHGSGFVRLVRGGGTTVPAIKWLELEGATL